jgi:Uma2 family endonuclease
MEPPLSFDDRSVPAPDEHAERARIGGITMPVILPRRRFTVDEYYRMAELGILRAGERVELIEGEIIQMEPIGSRHAGCVNRLTQLLVRLVGDDALVTIQNPVRLSDLSEPQPDVAVVRPRPDSYMTAHPGPDEVLLIIEVADTTVGFDRGTKAPLYALAAIPEYWVVDISADTLEVYREPDAVGYRDVRTYHRGDVLHPVMLPELDLPVASVLP